MRAALALCAFIAALGAAAIPESVPSIGHGWSCSDREARAVPGLSWLIGDRCVRWTWSAER